MKIKTKKRMTSEEYAKYMIDKHGISGLEYELIGDNIIDAPKRYALTFELNPVSMKEVSDTGFENKEFTIEVEEDLTEDTMIPILAHYSVFGFKTTKSNASINEEKSGNSIAFYIMNDDKTMTLIWKNGRLVK